MNNNSFRGHAAVLGSNVIFGLNVPVTKALLDGWLTPAGYMAVRTVSALLFFWVIQCFAPKERVSGKDLMIIALGGIMGFVVSQYLTALSLRHTSPVYFSMIVALSPIVVMLLAALFLKEPVTRRKVAGVSLGIAGALLLILHAGPATSGTDNLLGITLAIVSVTAYSVYLIIMRSVAGKYSAVTQMKWMFLFTAAIVVPMGAGEFSQQTLFSPSWGWSGVLELAFVVVFATAGGYFLMPFGMKYLKATTVSVYMNLQPIVASVAAIFIGQDVFTWDKPVSAALVIAGAYIVTTGRTKN